VYTYLKTLIHSLNQLNIDFHSQNTRVLIKPAVFSGKVSTTYIFERLLPRQCFLFASELSLLTPQTAIYLMWSHRTYSTGHY